VSAPAEDSTVSSPKRVFIETYGCQMNVADTQLMGGLLAEAGYERVPSAAEADVILVNTCAVREHAEERVLARLDSLSSRKRERPDLVMGVTGCMAEHLRDQLRERAPYVDLVFGPDAYRRLPSALALAQAGHPVVDVRLDKEETYEGAASRVEGINGWISIQRGCDKFCTFCIVPFVRGRERSSAPRDVLRQARELVAQGARELTLLGQTVNSYRYEDVDFADLLVAVARVEGVERLRFTSPYPLDFSERLIRVMAEEPKVMPHVHLPLQSGCDEVLERMKRGHTVAQYLALVRALRDAVQGLALTTDVIVGFPDESEASFERTLDVVEEVRFDSAFMFLYSQRSHTYASRHLPDSVPGPEKKARLQRLIERQEAISASVNAELVGRTVPVLVTGRSRRSEAHLTGKSDTFKSTVFPRDPARPALGPGDLVDVVVERTTSHTLLGRPA
jgi:tRNA-2-methylthio-N6-dimethylallyladenosine synthase